MHVGLGNLSNPIISQPSPVLEGGVLEATAAVIVLRITVLVSGFVTVIPIVLVGRPGVALPALDTCKLELGNMA